MKIRYFISIGLMLIFCMIPIQVFAVDFEVTDVQIDVYLKEDGHADVVEKHTYDFDSKFQGITREVFPKSDAAIVDFEAYEDEKALSVEQDEETYKVFRSGKKETINFELRYTIVNAVEKYEDGTQFYWTFFSERNKTDYGDLSITVHPPEKAVDVAYLGYDVAYGTGKLEQDGSVIFAMGTVSGGTNSDIRIVYESSLFPEAKEQKGMIRPELKEDEAAIQEEKAAFAKTQGDMETVGKYTIPSAVMALLGVVFYILRKSKGMRNAAFSQMENHFVPSEKLSMPATIQYTRSISHGPEMISAALLDLIRQGYVKQVTETSFELQDSTGANDHEASLIDLLFVKVGDGTTFTFDDLEAYTKDKTNHESYGESLVAWQSGITQEIKEADLYEKRSGFRWLIGFVSVALIPIIIQFARYELYPFMTLSIVLTILGLLTALLYSPRTLRGVILIEEWKQFRKRMKEVQIDEWEKLPVEDKYRAYIYGIGAKDAKLKDFYEQFERAEQRTDVRGIPYYAFYNSTYATQSFHMANTNASVNVDGTSSAGGSSSAGGGGVGGSGGGSGAF